MILLQQKRKKVESSFSSPSSSSSSLLQPPVRRASSLPRLRLIFGAVVLSFFLQAVDWSIRLFFFFSASDVEEETQGGTDYSHSPLLFFLLFCFSLFSFVLSCRKDFFQPRPRRRRDARRKEERSTGWRCLAHVCQFSRRKEIFLPFVAQRKKKRRKGGREEDEAAPLLSSSSFFFLCSCQKERRKNTILGTKERHRKKEDEGRTRRKKKKKKD